MIIPAEMLSIIARRRFIAEVHTETARQGLATIEALARGGITLFEISLAIPGAEELLRHFSGNQSIFAGAGSVLDARQAHEATRAGAAFIVSPIVAADLPPICAEQRVACILSALTPTEIIAAQRAGADLVNIYPISAVGGSNYLRSLYRQFTSLNLMVSGGVTLENAFEYLALPIRALGLSSTIAPRDLVEHGDWNALTHIARQFLMATRSDDPMLASSQPPSSIPARPPLLDTMRSPAYGAPPPMPAHPQEIPALSYSQSFPGLGSRSNPSQPGLPADPYISSQPGAPAGPSYPSQPGAPAGPSYPSQPSAPAGPSYPSRPGASAGRSAPSTPPGAPPPQEPEPFKPWDSKPVGDDWIN